MSRKPSDLLAFYRQATTSEPRRAPPDGGLEPTPRLILVRKSQLLVAAIGGGLAIVLAFLIGMAAGSEPDPVVDRDQAGPWVIRVITYDDTDNGRQKAKHVMSQLEQLGLGEVSLQRIPSERQLVVAIGAWMQWPERFKNALDMLKNVKKIPDRRTGQPAFDDAHFWLVRR